jgi:hypothetical protein
MRGINSGNARDCVFCNVKLFVAPDIGDHAFCDQMAREKEEKNHGMTSCDA